MVETELRRFSEAGFRQTFDSDESVVLHIAERLVDRAEIDVPPPGYQRLLSE